MSVNHWRHLRDMLAPLTCGKDRSTRLQQRTGLLWLVCALAAIGTAQAQTATEVVLHNFEPHPPKGANPIAGVIRDSAGNLYGTTPYGGAGAGGVYKLDTTGHLSVLYAFTGSTDGGNPHAGVIGDSAGNLYGTTVGGGTFGFGVVYKLDATGHETVLYSFTGGSDGGYPDAGVIRDPAGNLYGTASTGSGVVYRLDTTGHFAVLHGFTGGADGGTPYAGVVRDSAGNLYGTTYHGGTAGAGVVYKLDASSRHRETVLYSFTGGADGGGPNAIIRDSAGNLYGTTFSGGMAGAGAGFGAGVVYKLDTAGHETVLYSFTGGADGCFPVAGVVLDSAGNLYGTTGNGGTANGSAGPGVVFALDTSGQETVLYSFTGAADGAFPLSAVILDSAGNLYGTTFFGGTASGYAGLGLVYKVSAADQETVLYKFPAAVDGGYPTSGVIADSAGNLYGTTPQGGPANAGVVYKLGTTGETVLYTFTGAVDGSGPWGGVIRDSAGNVYGTTYAGGASGWGVVFKVDTSGHETVLYSFTGGADGGNPYAGVVRDSAGNLYGTTYRGGASGWGVVFKVDTSGQETVLYSFTGSADGGAPYAGVIRDSAGNLYGTTFNGGTPGCYSEGPVGCGVVYKLDTSGHETVLHTFTGGADGGNPYAGVIRDSAGNLYGTTYNGHFPYCGSGGMGPGCGVVYKLDSAGQETVLWTFGGNPLFPYAGVILDSAGNLYGTTGLGWVYELDTASQFTVLYVFPRATGGTLLYAGVIRDSAGNLYGTTYSGGRESSGVVFKLTPQ